MIKSYDDFFASMTEAAVSFTKPLLHQKDFKASFRAHLFKKPIPDSPTHTLSREDTTFFRAFRGFIEIRDAVDRLHDFETYVRRYPFAKTKITREKYVTFVIESYIQELYILKERLLYYAKMLGRAYSKYENVNALEVSRALCEYVEKSFDNITKTRGRHVHQFRYSDPDLERFSTISFLSEHMKEPAMKFMYRWTFKELRDKYRTIIKDANKSMMGVLDIYFKALGKILFLRHGNIRY